MPTLSIDLFSQNVVPGSGAILSHLKLCWIDPVLPKQDQMALLSEWYAYNLVCPLAVPGPPSSQPYQLDLKIVSFPWVSTQCSVFFENPGLICLVLEAAQPQKQNPQLPMLICSSVTLEGTGWKNPACISVFSYAHHSLACS